MLQYVEVCNCMYKYVVSFQIFDVCVQDQIRSVLVSTCFLHNPIDELVHLFLILISGLTPTGSTTRGTSLGLKYPCSGS